MKAALVAAVLLALVLPAQEKATFAPDAEGFIRNWLVLAPIAIDGESGATEIDKDFIGEATVKPKPDEKMNVGGKILTWKPHQTSDYFIDFLQAFGAERGEYVGRLRRGVHHRRRGDEGDAGPQLERSGQGVGQRQAGLQVRRDAHARQGHGQREVTLAKGQNVLMLKVVNEVNNWQGCARFLKDGAPVKNIKVSLTPQ